MCGICGFAGSGTLHDLSQMTAAMIHRGPDDQGLWHDPETPVFLGHRRLAIIDIAGGSQPMCSPDGSLRVVFNGEIYNHTDLRKELEGLGHVFITDHSDTEVLLHGYLRWGASLPERLNGMWAFAIYDRNRRILFLSRDRFGKKPLYYSLQNGTFAFASELTALKRHTSLSFSVSPKSLVKYFAYGYIPSPRSLYRSVFKLPPGNNLIFSLGDLRPHLSAYWEFTLEPFDPVPENAERVWPEQLRELIRRAVERRLMSDVPLGVFLSGGIDSSTITALAAGFLGKGRLKTFSIGFSERSFDESAYAAKAAGAFQTDHHLEALSMEKARDLLPEIISRLDEPLGDASLLPTYLLSRETRKHVTVALGGDGADELLAGYDPFHALKAAEWYQSLVPRPVHRAIKMMAGRLPVSHRNMSPDFKFKRALRGLSYPDRFRIPVWMGPAEPVELEALFGISLDPEDIYAEAIECWDGCSQDNIVDKTLQFFTRLYLTEDILVKTDRASMMNSLEVRAPFLDIELVDFIRKIPHSYKFRRGQTKYLLKRAMEPVLPQEIIHRRKKGFGAPVGRWFQEGSLTLDPGHPVEGMNTGVVDRILREHRDNRADHRLFLWSYWLLTAGRFF